MVGTLAAVGSFFFLLGCIYEWFGSGSFASSLWLLGLVLIIISVSFFVVSIVLVVGWGDEDSLGTFAVSVTMLAIACTGWFSLFKWVNGFE